MHGHGRWTGWLLVLTCALGLLPASPSQAGLTFDGVDDKVDITNSNAPAGAHQFANTSFSVCFWIATSSTGLAGLVQKATQTGGQGWKLGLNSVGNKVNATLLDASGTNSVNRVTTTSMTDGVERHLCAVFVTSTTVAATNSITLYVNGVPDQAAPTTSGLVYATSEHWIKFGIRDTSAYYAGSLDDVRLDSPALAAPEILHLALSKLRGGGLLSHRPVLYVPLTDCPSGSSGQGVTFADRSGSGYPGTGFWGANGAGLTCRPSPFLRGMGWVQ
jgi:Concanavalin A-like lectin/glucanases superfamily